MVHVVDMISLSRADGLAQGFRPPQPDVTEDLLLLGLDLPGLERVRPTLVDAMDAALGMLEEASA
jgi:hypothetical protein